MVSTSATTAWIGYSGPLSKMPCTGPRSCARQWKCTCKAGSGCNAKGLKGVWNCPGFYTKTITISDNVSPSNAFTTARAAGKLKVTVCTNFDSKKSSYMASNHRQGMGMSFGSKAAQYSWVIVSAKDTVDVAVEMYAGASCSGVSMKMASSHKENRCDAATDAVVTLGPACKGCVATKAGGWDPKRAKMIVDSKPDAAKWTQAPVHTFACRRYCRSIDIAAHADTRALVADGGHPGRCESELPKADVPDGRSAGAEGTNRYSHMELLPGPASVRTFACCRSMLLLKLTLILP